MYIDQVIKPACGTVDVAQLGQSYMDMYHAIETLLQKHKQYREKVKETNKQTNKLIKHNSYIIDSTSPRQESERRLHISRLRAHTHTHTHYYYYYYDYYHYYYYYYYTHTHTHLT